MAALRSGEYNQVVGKLAVKRETGEKLYCCEGVAFERYGARFGYTYEWNSLSQMISITPEGSRDTMVAPSSFWQSMGMLASSTQQFRFVLPDGLTLNGEDGWTSVQYAELNDAGFTFPQIADLIEWQFLPPKNGSSGE